MNPAQTLKPGLMVIHGNHIEDLRELCVEWMRRHPLQPLENEHFLVYSNGIAQWLKQALAEDSGCGIAAALQFDLPSRFLWGAYRQVLEEDAIPTESPLDKLPLTWRLLRLLPSCMADPVFAPLAHFLGDDPELRKRHQLAERLADLFDQYQVYRADWLSAWAAGRDELISWRHGVQPVAAHDRWQPALWRAILADINNPEWAQGRAFVHPQFLAALAQRDQPPTGFPRRLIVFGITSLPAQMLEALAAMAKFSQILLCVHNPCQHHWGDIVEDKDLLRHQYRRHPSRPLSDSQSLHGQAQALLAGWGKQGRDYINLLDQHDDPSQYRQWFERIDMFEAPSSAHLLGQLQHDIFDLRPLPETRETWPPLDPQRDRSIRFHLAHSPQREVEILHDRLLAEFNADRSLRPRDIIVMVPDIQAYAPAIQAVFGQYTRADTRYIPFTIADQGLRGKTPLSIALEQLLSLPQGRLTVSQVLDLLDAAPLRARFKISAHELPRIRQWVDGAGIRWGLDGHQRAALGQQAGLEQNTWEFGLRRLFLGYASDGEAFAGIEPYPDIGGLDASLLGPLNALLQALRSTQARLSGPHPAALWGQHFRQLLADFFLAEDDAELALLTQLDTALETWLGLCEAAQLETPLPLAVAHEGWLGGLDQHGLSQRFLSGAVNFCTLLPMRSIPFRQVCLLGMNDGDYPRSKTPMDFDLMAGDYRPGDRSRRDDDRYLLLEALLSAREKLYISWVGRSIRDDTEQPPSVLISQLRDHLAAGWRCTDAQPLLPALTTVHPLQAFSRRYFSASQDPETYTYASEWAAVHQPPATPSESASLAAWNQVDHLTLEVLQSFLADPVRAFFRQRLGIQLDAYDATLQDDEVFGLDALQHYQFSQQLLDSSRLTLDRGGDIQHALRHHVQRLQGRGELPLAGFGPALAAELAQPLSAQLQRYLDEIEPWPQPIEQMRLIHVATADLTLEDWLGELRSNSLGQLASLQLLPRKLRTKEKKLIQHRLLKSFVCHVAACASGIDVTSILIGEDVSLRWDPLDTTTASEIVGQWLAAYAEGMRQPLPVARKTALSWLSHIDTDETRAWAEASKSYQGSYLLPGEVQHSASLARQYPDFASLSADPGQFGHWAQQLYQALLQYPPMTKDDTSSWQ